MTRGETAHILYFGNAWFAENRTSSHHVARWLAQRQTVYYIECPGLRAPKGSGRDLRKIGSKLLQFVRGPRPVEGGIKLWTVVQIPLHRVALVRRLNRWLVHASLRWMMWRQGIRAPITWFVVPHLSSVAGRLGEQLCVYYCIDDYAAMPDVNVAAIAAMDEEMTRRADLVFVASETLLSTKRELNPQAHHSPHGVDAEHFARASDESLAVPHDIAHLVHPIVGFFGLVERWIDVELIDYLAERRPNWTFLVIGRVAIPAGELPRQANLHFIGKRSYADLPAYGKQFDAAIIPYRLNRQVLHANPLKLREYLAMGKPVVSVGTPEIRKFADVVEIADSREQFLAKLDEVLSRPDSPDDARRRIARVASSSWESRVQEVWAVVAERLAANADTPRKSRECRVVTSSIS